MARSWQRWVAAALVAGAVACTDSGSNGGPTGPSPTLTPPTIEGPTGDVQLGTLRPTLTVRNGTSSVAGSRTYEFQISDRADFSVVLGASQAGVPEGTDGTTSYLVANDLQPSTRMYWRARFTQGSDTSDWSETGQFRTKLMGFNRPGELYDPLVHDETIGAIVGSTTFMGARGLRLNTPSSWVQYQLAATLPSGEISVEVEGLAPNNPGPKARIFSMMDNAPNLFYSKYLFNVQYRGAQGNPDNAISYKVLMGDNDLKYEPDLGTRLASVRSLNPSTTYLWTATWGSTFRLVVREGGANGPVIYDHSESTPGSYTPSPHIVMLGANDPIEESGSYGGAIYRNLWVGSGPRPASLGSALRAR